MTVKEEKTAKTAVKSVKKETVARKDSKVIAKKEENNVVKTVKLKTDKQIKKIEIKKPVNAQITKKASVDAQGRAYATGKRKNAIAKVWLKKGEGKITINGIEPNDYLKNDLLVVTINTPFVATQTEDKFDVVCQALGGGLSGQADAIKLGIAKALIVFNEIYRPELKSAGLLTRDARVVERKKAGLIKARKGQVYKRR